MRARVTIDFQLTGAYLNPRYPEHFLPSKLGYWLGQGMSLSPWEGGTKVVQHASPGKSVVFCSGQGRIYVLVQDAGLLCSIPQPLLLTENHGSHQQEGTGFTQVAALASVF